MIPFPQADRLFFQQLHKHFETAVVEDDPNRAVYEREGLKLMTITRKVKPVQQVRKRNKEPAAEGAAA